METEENVSVHRLEASAPATGGLVIKKKETNDSDSTFKVPQTSLLGLDRLAAAKRQEREKQQRLISFKDSEYDDEMALTPRSDSSRTPDLANVHKLNRQYRELKDDTPSHGGGVSEKARGRLAEQKEKEKRGVHVSTKDLKKSRRDGDNNRNFDARHRGHRDRDRNRDYDRRDRRDSDKRYNRDKSDRDNRHYSNRSDRKRSSDSERSLHTPHFKDEPHTPYLASTSSASWDDDDDRSSSKRSSWDFPTPKDNRKHSEWSTRSSSSISRLKKFKIEDDTPRPTPAHKYNSWANDRKKSGATPMPGKHR